MDDPITKLSKLGNSSEQKLNKIGINKISQLAAIEPNEVATVAAQSTIQKWRLQSFIDEATSQRGPNPVPILKPKNRILKSKNWINILPSIQKPITASKNPSIVQSSNNCIQIQQLHRAIHIQLKNP